MVPNRANHHMIGPKKAVLFPEIGRVKFFDHSPARIVKCASIFNLKRQTNKQKKTRIQMKQKKLKKKRIVPENRSKKQICDRPG